jgi:CRP-like cAMP-binding protein
MWRSGQSVHHKGLFDELPPALSLELNLAMKEELVTGVPIFDECPPQTVLAVIRCLTPSIVIPEQAVVRQGEKGLNMYFVLRGHLGVEREEEVEVFDQPEEAAPRGIARITPVIKARSLAQTIPERSLALPKAQGRIEVRVRHFATISSGLFFGEGALFGTGIRNATVRAKVYCELEILSFRSLFELMASETHMVLAKLIKKEARNKYAQHHQRQMAKEQEAAIHGADVDVFKVKEVAMQLKRQHTKGRIGGLVRSNTTKVMGMSDRLQRGVGLKGKEKPEVDTTRLGAMRAQAHNYESVERSAEASNPGGLDAASTRIPKRNLNLQTQKKAKALAPGDSVKVVKSGSQKGKTAVVKEVNWNDTGRVKV